MSVPPIQNVRGRVVFFCKRIRFAALENGHVNTDTGDSIKQRLITALFQFRFDEQEV